MAKTCKVTVNNETFVANCGDLLLDGAMMNGVDLPHDCRSGICGTCRVRLVAGKVFGGDDDGSDMIHACWTPSLPQFDSSRASRISPGGSTPLNESESWPHEN